MRVSEESERGGVHAEAREWGANPRRRPCFNISQADVPSVSQINGLIVASANRTSFGAP